MNELDLYSRLKALQRLGHIAEFSKEGERFRVRPIGGFDLLGNLGEMRELTIPEKPNDQVYYFLSHIPGATPPSDLRPGSGVIRVVGGKSEGPAGTLTCFLSTADGRDNYFVAAGHVLTNFWIDPGDDESDRHMRARRRGGPRKEKRAGKIYRNQKGFPSTGSTRFLGELTSKSKEPSFQEGEDKDIGIVLLEDGIEPVQRTTCYGTFSVDEEPRLNGEKEKQKETQKEKLVPEGLEVMKCGAEETHWTFAFVASPKTEVTIYGPDGTLYLLKDQIILSQRAESRPGTTQETDPPQVWSAAKNRQSRVPFAVPGDSGSLVVTKESRRPVGMLVAGSILDGRYVVTPFPRLKAFWEKQGLVLRKG